jgi:hypothetical protein
MGDPKPGTPEWQAKLNEEIAKHDREVAERDAKINAELAEKARKAAEEAAKNDDK